MTANDWLAHILILPLTTFALCAAVLFVSGLCDAVDGWLYWREFRDEAEPRIRPARPRGMGCAWVALLAVVGLALARVVWR
jgi:hypothetical protein